MSTIIYKGKIGLEDLFLADDCQYPSAEFSRTGQLSTSTMHKIPNIFYSGAGSFFDTDGTLASNSDSKSCSQKAVKTYVDYGAKFFTNFATTQGNVTGDGTAYEPLTSAWDLSEGCFVNGVFTVPDTGYYLIGSTVALQGITSSHDNLVIKLAFAEGTFVFFQLNPYAISVTGALTLTCSEVLYLTAAYAINLSIQVSGGTKVVDIGTTTRFSGALIKKA